MFKYPLGKLSQERILEIGFFYIMRHLKRNVVEMHFEAFLQTFCPLFDVDYTSITILQNAYLSKLRPTKREKTVIAITISKYRSLVPIDYRTVRKYEQEWHDNGRPEIYPKLRNLNLKEDLQKFVKAYVKLFNFKFEFVARLLEDMKESEFNENQ